jgi:predicted Zn finger-like uncharacterized protein
MYTQCPDCLTIYRIGAESLAGGRGSFRCGHCATVFDALPTLIDKLPLEVIGELPRHPAPNAPPLLAVPAMHPQPRQIPLFEQNAAQTSAEPSERTEPSLPGDWLSQVPPTLYDPVGRASFDMRGAKSGGPDSVKPKAAQSATSRHYPRPQAPASRGWVWSCVLLACTLGAQIAWAERERLLAEPVLRGALDQVLGWFGERLPPMVQLDALTLVSREVRPHSSVPGALLISAAVRNDSNVALAYPRIEVKMMDLGGRAIALRRFTPDEYLSDPAGQLRGLQPGALVPLVFEVVDPGRDAFNYEFAFREP